MGKQSREFLLTGIRAPFDASEEEILKIAARKMKRARSNAAELHFRLFKKSFDARRRSDIQQVCTVLVRADGALPENLSEGIPGLSAYSGEKPQIVHGQTGLCAPPLIVGMGPAGLFTALILAEEGYRPVLIDRGDEMEARVRATSAFRAGGALDPESNIQFGAGGAGAFSDGKLVTRVNDPLCRYVLERLTAFGAPEEIMWKAKPHVGTDLLRGVVEGIIGRIVSLGGEVHYRTCMTDFTEEAGGVRVKTRHGDFFCGALILAIGHSARDTFALLGRKSLMLEPKPFSVGVRIEHLRTDIDRAMYGEYAGHPLLGPAEYALSDTTGPRGVYTFCMCPGGEVVTAASESSGVVVNGMSYHARNGKNSNAAVAVTVLPSDVGGSISGAIAFQRELEHAAFAAGGGNYAAPIETVGDFLGGFKGREPDRILPTYGAGRVKTADLSHVLPSFVVETLAAGIRSFDRKLPGFAVPDAVLTGVETRTSSPLRILRDETRSAVGHPLIYPVGEGAGYAGGITSSALDGLRTALALMARYAPERSLN